MDNAEECFLLEEEKHIWQKKRKSFVFDQQTVDDEGKKAQQVKRLKGLENENKKLRDLLIKSKRRYDIEYKKIKDENIRLKEAGGADRPLEQHGSSGPEEDGHVPGPHHRDHEQWLQVRQHPLGGRHERNDQPEEQGCHHQPVPRHEDQEGTHGPHSKKCQHCPKVFIYPFTWKSFRNHRKLCRRKNK